MKCSQCSMSFEREYLNKVTYLEDILICNGCAKKNENSEPNLDLFLLELDFITSAALPLGSGARAMFLLLKKYKSYLPFIQYDEEAAEAIRLFIKAFRQTDCIPNDPQESNEISLDMVAWHLCNAHADILVKAFKRIVEKRSAFQEEL